MTQDDFIRSLGEEAYRVGGSVRDEILGRTPKDSDYVIFGCSLERLGQLLRAAVAGRGDVRPLKLRDGRQAGWRVTIKGLGCMEVVLPRTERSTGPGHTDFEIILDENLTFEDDAIRRDFTINALYRSVDTDGVIDVLGGVRDIKRGLIQTTHPDSFRDDPLRIMRALRFVSQLGFDLSKSTYAEMRKHADAVDGLTEKGVSGTALDELKKLLMGVEPGRALRLARDTKALETLLPELKPMIGFDQESQYHSKTVDEHTFDAIQAAANVKATLRVRMALLWHDSGKPETAWRGFDGRLHYYEPSDEAWAENVRESSISLLCPKPVDHEVAGKRIARRSMKRLNTGATLQREVEQLIERHMVPVHGQTKPTKVRRWRVEIGDEMVRDLITMRFCDVVGGKDPASVAARDAAAALGRLEEIRQQAQEQGVPTDVTQLAIGGADLEDIVPHNRRKMLLKILDEVVCEPSEQTYSREWQLGRIEALKSYSFAP